MKVKVTNICSEETLPKLRETATELDRLLTDAVGALDETGIQQFRLNLVSVDDAGTANRKFADANTSWKRFKTVDGLWQTELSIAVILAPNDVLQWPVSELKRMTLAKLVEFVRSRKLPKLDEPNVEVLKMRLLGLSASN